MLNALPPNTRLESRVVNTKKNFRDEKIKVMRDIFCVGEHDSGCEETAWGWICADDCPVEDMKSANKLVNEFDELIDVEEVAERDGWLMKRGVAWSMTRVSLQRTFVNGRSRRSNFTYSRDTFSGRTWTRWGARRQIKKHRQKSRPSMSYYC